MRVVRYSPAATALAVSVWVISAPLSEVLYLIQGADLTSNLSGFSTPSSVPFSLTTYSDPCRGRGGASVSG